MREASNPYQAPQSSEGEADRRFAGECLFGLYLVFAPGTSGSNRYGARPIPNSCWVRMAAAAALVGWVLTAGLAAAGIYTYFYYYAGVEGS